MKSSKGAYLKGEKLQNFIREAKSNKDFTLVNSKLEVLAGFDIESSRVLVAYHFDELLDNGDVLQGEFVILQSKDNKINISYNKTKHQGGSTVFVTGNYIVPFEDRGILKKYIMINGKEIVVEDKPYKKELEESIQEELEHDPSYEPGEIANAVTAQAGICLYDFPSFYNHCGPDCGDGLTFGGGTPINGLDSCCRTHDRCWKNFGDGDCKCDADIVGCAAQYLGAYPKNASMVIGWFTPRAC